jgi:hypothetical protein
MALLRDRLARIPPLVQQIAQRLLADMLPAVLVLDFTLAVLADVGNMRADQRYAPAAAADLHHDLGHAPDQGTDGSAHVGTTTAKPRKPDRQTVRAASTLTATTVE